ncbi:hypothetical protein PRUPE_3G236400 [Prunus persica]|uniref:Uncharacterized protein n=1 Tax=Prunus persica TaxID=3760 RepID=A0A251Q4L2_PRUPE|nr:hypothetical protein PRUPE_3G236400 [Prunus persica]ONI18748.1 hypothetical protein PRUPE_3G236400 [Prunus persica]ONI18749.1 hypothetical protein PRUPE_3G236400 [Prunus persica]ONI18750.1 hypothetical protein PRUPE_3G236400 [Prunus persica]
MTPTSTSEDLTCSRSSGWVILKLLSTTQMKKRVRPSSPFLVPQHQKLQAT